MKNNKSGSVVPTPESKEVPSNQSSSKSGADNSIEQNEKQAQSNSTKMTINKNGN